MKLTSRTQAGGSREFIEKFASAQDALRRDPYRIGLLPAPVAAQVFQMPLPFPTEFWIAEDAQGRITGRIGANLSPVHAGKGYIGFFEAADERTAHALIEAALRWFAGRATEVFGPLNLNTWLQYRFRTQQDETPIFAHEPVNPPEYPAWWLSAGFEPVETYHSEASGGLGALVAGTLPGYEKAVASGFRFRPFDAENLLEKEVPVLHRISMATFSQAFLFEPLPLEAFRQLYVPLARKFDLSLAYFAVNRQNQEVGFFFSFVEKDYLVMKTIALLPEARGLGVSNAMVHHTVSQAMKRGIDQAIHALVRDGIQSESYARKAHTLWRHHYALYRRKAG